MSQQTAGQDHNYKKVELAGAGAGNTIGISDVSNGEEWIMAPATDYLMRITNRSGADLTFSWEMLWYELVDIH